MSFSIEIIPMKSCFIFLLITLSIVLFKAQNDDYRFVASTYTGYTYLSIYNKVTGNDLNIENPSYTFAVDVGINKFFSLGLTYGVKNFELNNPNYSWANPLGIIITEDVSADFDFKAGGLRPLFHYANSNKWDLYSGLTFGIINTQISDNSSNPNYQPLLKLVFNEINKIGNTLYFNAPFFGARYYLEKHIGLGVEFDLFSATVGLTGRF